MYRDRVIALASMLAVSTESRAGGSEDSYAAGFDASWEPDIFDGALTSGSSLAARAAGSLAQSVFDGGRVDAWIEIQSAIQQQALAAYQAVVLAVLEEVENAHVSLANHRLGRTAALGKGVESARNAVLLAGHQYSGGLIGFQTVLDSERSPMLPPRARRSPKRAPR